MSRFCFCNCPAGFSADPERHAPDCPGRSGAGKARTPVPATTPALTVSATEELDAALHWRNKHALAIKERDALQLLLTAADERADNRDSEIFAQVQSALRRSFSLGQIYWQQADSDSTCQQNKSDQTMEVQEQHILNVLKSLGAALKPAERTNTSGKAHCPDDGICHTSDETCAEAVVRVESIKPTTCAWQYGAFSWRTSCGQEWMLNDGTPEQNGMKFCHSCGKTLVVEGEPA